ncbi:MAG: MBL fold metallo-hydrolase [Christensenellales bacterium]|jgi:phosphoribosyl 1,2-cyclic phosphodiesterase
MKLEFCPLNSGSNGNVTYVAAGDTRLLIDAGLPGRSVVRMLEQIKVLPETINGILVTHEHSDHVKGVGVLSRKYHIPVYANEATWEAMYRIVGDVPPHLRRVFESENDFFVGDVGVFPIPISHDTVEPVAFRLYAGSRSVAVATDMGRVSKQVLRYLAGTDIILLESNHDPEMLRHNMRYPEALKRRILGARGHLSNLNCAETLLSLYETGVQHALLGHLSQDNNTPELAMQTVENEILRQGLRPGKDIRLEMAWRDRVGGYFSIE